MNPESKSPIVTMEPEAVVDTSAESEVPEAAPAAVSNEPIRWQAPERIDEYRPPVWYAIYLVVAIAFMAVAVFLMKSYTFAALIVVMAVALVVYTRRPAQEANYVLSPKGLYVNDQLYGFGEFRAFGVVQESDRNTLKLIPTKRFQPAIEAHFPSEVGEVIVDMLAARLPMQDTKNDPIDKLSRRLRL